MNTTSNAAETRTIFLTTVFDQDYKVAYVIETVDASSALDVVMLARQGGYTAVISTETCTA